MRIRSITLDNVRRFAERVSVGPIGDGVTLLCEPNEAGKSTLFDALHALFFQKHSSWNKEVSGLQPHSGGKVTVECTLEEGGALWRVRKRWHKGAGGEARVWRDGVLVHQDDAAEDWIAARVAGEGSGPGGLLWVRQGRVTLAPAGSKTQQDAEHEERRDLLTAVSGAMDAVTGGERMDRALDRVREMLGQLQTSTGKLPKHGAWAEAVANVTELEKEETWLAGLVEDLKHDLDERRSLAGELAGLEDAEAAAERKTAIEALEQALNMAERRGREIDAARTRATLAAQTLASAREESARHARIRTERVAAAELAVAARAKAAAAHETLEAAQERHAQTEAALKAAREAESRAQAVIRRIREREVAEAAQQGRAALEERIRQAEAAEAERIAHHAKASAGPDAKTVERVERIARDIEARRAARDAGMPRLSASYLPGAPQITVSGKPLPEGEERTLSPDGQVEIPGIGRLRIAVARDAGPDGLASAEAALAEALRSGGWGDVEALRAAARARAEAERQEELAAQRRDTLAPDGIAVLRERLAAMQVVAEVGAEDLPDHATATARLAEAEAALAAAIEAEAGQRALRDEARLAANTARVEADAAAGRLQRAEAEARNLPEADPAGEEARLVALEEAAGAAAEELRRLENDAPDSAALKAKLSRLRAISEQTRTRIVEIRERRAALKALITSRAEEGVEEALVDVRQRLEVARRDLDRITFEVDMLRRLRVALEDAQSAARDAYFEPVARELRPLLGDLWGDADLVWSDDTLLPSALVRKGTTEPIDVLSGGTQEQIAFLVRLAFARLLAKAGRHAPLILDDALVYSDDDRIEKMFDALHGAAGDLQILVLSCRQRVFRDLGAPRLSFERAEAE